MARRRVVVAVIVTVVLVGILLVLFGGKNNPVTSLITGSSSPPVPTFAFKNVQTGFESTVARVDKKKQLKAAKAITPDVQKQVTALLQAGYVDPDTWGDAGAIKDLFTGPAVDQVEGNIDTLTLGSSAGDTYESLNPNASRIKVVGLTDGNANATRAMAEFEFTGKATLKDGTFATVSVTGTLFFVPDGNDWKIESFHVRREITPKKPKASTSASPTSSESQ